MLTARVRWRRQRVLKSGTAQSSPIRRSRLSTKPVVCRVDIVARANGATMSTMPNRSFIVRQVWIDASLQACGRPRLPSGVASHVMSGSNQIVSETRRLSASLSAGQFRVLQVGASGLPIRKAITLDSQDESPQAICATEPIDNSNTSGA